MLVSLAFIIAIKYNTNYESDIVYCLAQVLCIHCQHLFLVSQHCM